MFFDYSRIDNELLPFLDVYSGRTISRANLAAHRLEAARVARPPSPEGLQESNVTIKAGNGELKVNVFTTLESDRSALLWMHGGGYLMGSGNDHVAKTIAHRLDITVFSVDYRLAPEYPFPAAIEDCHAALCWLMDGAANGFEIDVDRVAIGGASAGGGLAAGLALLNRDRERFPIAIQLLLYPMIDNLHVAPSARYDNHPIWNRESSQNAW